MSHPGPEYLEEFSKTVLMNSVAVEGFLQETGFAMLL
jgi:hypothetical protein